jgi:thiamine biosynthesis lipoprotein
MNSRLIRVSRPAMGSLFEIYAGGEDAGMLERIAGEALDRVDWLEQQLSHFLPDSDLCRINARAFEAAVPVAPDLFALLLRLRRWSEETQGAFDCTAGKLVRAWGFFRRGQANGESVAPPDPEQVVQIVAQIGWRHIELDEEAQTIRFLTDAVELHLGAVGKGYIVQCAADYMRSAGVSCALLHSGYSSIVAIGSPPDSMGWPIGIPGLAPQSPPLMIVHLCDAALSTSGSTEQCVEIGGVRTGHLFDPRNGLPVQGTHSVSVVSRDAAEGDALSTACFVQGAVWAARYCRTHTDIGVLWVHPAAAAPGGAELICLGHVP